MKRTIYLFALCFVQEAIAQVGVNTENPQGIFNIDGAKDNPLTGTPTAAQQANDFLVMPDGKVGIGTTVPGTSLDVTGAITNRETTVTLTANTATLPANASMVRLTGAATAAITVTAAAAPNAGQRLIVYNNTTGGFAATFNNFTIANGQALEFVYSNGGWRTTDNGASSVGAPNEWHITGNVGTSATTNFIGTTNNVDFVTRTNNTERMRVTSGGNIGIGTTAPASHFSVVSNGAGGGVADDIEIASYNATPSIGLYFKSALGTQTAPTNLSNGTSLGIITWSGQSSGGMQGLSSITANYRGNGTTNLSDLAFSTSSAERLRITDTGNVGIGTTAPNAPLQFANTGANRKIVLYEATNNDHQFYGLGINSSALRYQVDATSSNHIFSAGTSSTASNELMRIQGNGNVGIGSTNPTTKLQVEGSISTSILSPNTCNCASSGVSLIPVTTSHFTMSNANFTTTATLPAGATEGQRMIVSSRATLTFTINATNLASGAVTVTTDRAYEFVYVGGSWLRLL